MNELGKRIKEARTAFHLSQEYVARQLGVSRSAVADMESGKRKVSAMELKKLSELFLVSSDELLYGKALEMPASAFARGFEALDENDQREIMNLIEFKRAMKGSI